EVFSEYLKGAKELNLDSAGEFLVLVSTLVHMKSQRLLPKTCSEKQQLEQADSQAELSSEEKALQLQIFQQAVESFRTMELESRKMFTRYLEEMTFDFVDDTEEASYDLYALFNAFRKIIDKLPAKTVTIDRETLTVKEKINFILEVLGSDRAICFETLFEQELSRLSVIVTFLALLELIALGLVRVFQRQAFSTLWIIRRHDSHTAY
ncbi:MAG TPA: segregation/condensation protein A, partial [Thermodesulfovibrionia bacterium]|nr:segregation/condensation protein A [Thermodesulfovibrionia bacterium]